jgi:hypothetical protein
MTPLKIDEQGLPNGWADVQPGDAVVAFSRKDIYRARKVLVFCLGLGSRLSSEIRFRAQDNLEAHAAGDDVMFAC